MKKRIAALLLLLSGTVSTAVDFSGVPGKVLDYQPLTYFGSGPPLIFISDPEILVLSNGDYIAAHALAGYLSGSGTSGKTTIFRSTDKGITWITNGIYNGILRGSLFEYEGAVYLMGANNDDTGNTAVIMKSTDNGSTWTSTSFTTGGPATPNNPVVFSNRIWSAAGTSDYSVPTDSNLMIQASWKLTGGFPSSSTSWLTSTNFSGEGQIVASPELGVFILPKTTDYMYTKVARVNSSGSVTFDPTNNFAALPGAEKKFGAMYDPVSRNFYVLSNPIMPQDYGVNDPNMIRNTAAVLTSQDLFNWKVEKIFIYSSDAEKNGFGYLNFDFDDTNMAVIARTAFPVGSNDPNRGHDSNLLTFHKLNDFRHLAPDQYLTISGNQILRYERTQYQSAPLGSFTLGSTFAGTALTSPNGMGTTSSGEVYIRESSGRILHFDSLGNFIETNSSAPVTFQSAALTVVQPPAGECAWTRASSGNWSDLLNWYYWGRPDTVEEIAVFGSAATSATTITIPTATQTWNFNTDGNNEGWVVSSASNTVVSGGFLQGSANTTSNTVQIYRKDRFFYGTSVPEIRIRLRADANCAINFYWATTLADSTGASSRKLTQSYTNNGAFQDFTFMMAGNTNWDGQAITQLRFDPQVHTTAANREFAVDSITIPRESYRLKGLRFRNTIPYTLSGDGQLRIQANNGSGSVEVLQGRHTNDVALILGSDTDIMLADSTSLHMKQGVDLNGKTMQITGSGRLLMQGAFVMNGGAVTVDGTVPLTFTNNSTGASLDGTLQFLPAGTFAPSSGDSYTLLENPGVLGSNRFSQVSLPSLNTGLKWNTNTLYSTGTVSVETTQHSLIVTTARGNSVPATGTNTYDYGTVLTAVLTNSPILNGTTTQYVCRGWTGTGSVPASGTSTNTGSFTVTTNSTLSWLWTTNYWLNTAASTGGSVNVSNGWKTNGASVQITATADTYYHFTGWSGSVTTNSAQITLLMNHACSVTAGFAQNVTSNTATPEWWLAQYGLTNFTSDAAADTDGDGLSTWQEYIAGTDPTNAASCLQITGGSVNAQQAVIRWSSASNRLYSISRTTNLLEPFSILSGASNLPATPPENTYTNPSGGNAAYYRIGVQQ